MTQQSNVNNKTTWIAALLIAITFFSVNGFLAYRTALTMAQNTESISNTLHILNLIEELKFHLFRAESAQRGFLITADEAYLNPYNISVAKTQSLINTLSEATTEIPQQKVRFNTLQQHVSEKIAEMGKIIKHVRNNQDHAALQLENTDRGYILSLKILTLIEEMEIDEHLLLNDTRSASEAKNTYMLWTLLTANFVGLCLALGTFYATFRYSSRLRKLNADIETANEYLEDKVQMRTEELQQYSEELERSNRELEDFAFVASHDLQEPLRKIRAFGDRLIKKYGDNLGEQGKDYIIRMQSASERMSRLIEDLLSFSRVTTQQKPFEEIDLNALLQETLENLEYAIEDREAVVEVGPLPHITGDASQIRQVFANLLSNSIKFTAPDTSPRISVHCDLNAASSGEEASQKMALIKVMDNGIGFDDQYKDRIFNLFQRLHGKGEYTGTGIGLAICRKIIERHGGTIDVQSQEGKGTTFILTLPLAPTPHPSPSTESEP